MDALEFINELLQSFQALVYILLNFTLTRGVTVGGILIALAVLSIFIRIIVGGLKR